MQIAIVRGRSEETCPATALRTWLQQSKIETAPWFRKVGRTRLSEDAVRQMLLKRGNCPPYTAEVWFDLTDRFQAACARASRARMAFQFHGSNSSSLWAG